MNVLAFIGVGITGAVLSVIMKQYRPEFSVYISLLSGMIMLGGIINALAPVVTELMSFAEITDNGFNYGGVLLKTLAVCYLTQTASESCSDAGEKSIATKIDFAGKCAVVIISLPLFKELVRIVKSLLA